MKVIFRNCLMGITMLLLVDIIVAVGGLVVILIRMVLMLFVVFMMYGIGVMIRLLTQMYLLGEIQIRYVRPIKLIMLHEIIEL